jgi:adenine phosphoribosyltransferase
MTLNDRIKAAVRDVPDFPKKGILFKDITPVLADPQLCSDAATEMTRLAGGKPVDAVAGIESRGFLFGMMLAERLKVPFIPVRKHGKLPYQKVQHEYTLEYGSAIIEIHTDAIRPGMHVLIHDDLLATGGTAAAAAELIRSQGGRIGGFSFLIALDFLKGADRLTPYSTDIMSLVTYY